MSHYKRQVPTVQAGSMADIAFLLLIFFLVATKVPNDKGLARKLPADCLNPPCVEKVKERNILEIRLNKDDEIFVEDDVVLLNDLERLVLEFVDNNGDGNCYYCQGNQLINASQNPKKAVISLISDRETSYLHFINVQNEITNAYYKLRANYSKKELNKLISELSKDEINEIKKAYPFILSEASIN